MLNVNNTNSKRSPRNPEILPKFQGKFLHKLLTFEGCLLGMFQVYLGKVLGTNIKTTCFFLIFSTHLGGALWPSRQATCLVAVGLEDSWPFEPNVLAKRTPQESSMPTFEDGEGKRCDLTRPMEAPQR